MLRHHHPHGLVGAEAVHKHHCHGGTGGGGGGGGQALKVAVVDVTHLDEFAAESSIEVTTKPAVCIVVVNLGSLQVVVYSAEYSRVILIETKCAAS